MSWLDCYRRVIEHLILFILSTELEYRFSIKQRLFGIEEGADLNEFIEKRTFSLYLFVHQPDFPAYFSYVIDQYGLKPKYFRKVPYDELGEQKILLKLFPTLKNLRQESYRLVEKQLAKELLNL